MHGSTAGKNIKNIEMESQKCVELEPNKGNISNICKHLSFEETPEGSKGKIQILKELSLLKSGHLALDCFEEDDIQEMLHFVCCS